MTLIFLLPSCYFAHRRLHTLRREEWRRIRQKYFENTVIAFNITYRSKWISVTFNLSIWKEMNIIEVGAKPEDNECSPEDLVLGLHLFKPWSIINKISMGMLCPVH